VKSTTLDDVFVHYTGRDLRDALQDPAPRQFPDSGGSMQRTWAIIEREMRRFRRSPLLIIMSLIFPLLQLIVLGYAFGGNVRNLTIAVVDQDGGRAGGARARAGRRGVCERETFHTISYGDEGSALDALRAGRVNGVLTIPPDYSRRVVGGREPRLAIIQDNTDNFVAATMGGVGRRPGDRAQREARDRAHLHLDPPRRGRALPVRAVRAVPAAGIDRHVDLHDGDDRRRHHLHRRQGARPS
jgi:hypothetical protein